MDSEPEMPLINAIITTFPGLPTYNLPLPASTTISSVLPRLRLLLPPTLLHSRLLLTPTSSHYHPPSAPLSALTTSSFLTLRLHPPLCGGKGGFGSQLRAAGGRMSSRKKRGQQENNDSCRNLDGRRMRTVKEAKALAAYLEIRPEMGRKEREARKERWRKVVEEAERGGRNGSASTARFDDLEWLESTEEERVRTREAVERVMKELEMGGLDGEEEGEGGSSGSGSDVEAHGGGDGDIGEGSSTAAPAKKGVKEMKFSGWDDEDDEFLSSDEEMSDIAEEDEEEGPVEEESKGKQPA
ncbi:telomere stability and silencing-domain-containing protein [Tuber borchii]|uniref:Telomere stability and silencing-domain-containing protein n=1 Tax=Tuber borchii TaxID=42251 RepID=A0A2T6ZHV0_TUBBO|nr:telomere stability and silencing-domain-containing protein [Tuber borchii]